MFSALTGWLGVLLGVVLLAACSTTHQARLAQGQSAYDAGQYELAISTLDPLAADGDKAAAYWTGRSYEAMALAGDAARLNDAARWYWEAARKDYSDSLYRLGRLLYFSGEEPELGVQMLQSAAACGNVEAGRVLRQENLPPTHERCNRSDVANSAFGPAPPRPPAVRRN